MKASFKKAISDALVAHRDQFATMEHERWAHWQSYLHSKCVRQSDGSLVIPAALVERWERQIHTEFDELSKEEQSSDLEQVDKFLALVEAILADEANRA